MKINNIFKDFNVIEIKKRRIQLIKKLLMIKLQIKMSSAERAASKRA